MSESQPPQTVPELIARLRQKTQPGDVPAWQTAGPLGAAAVKPLAELLPDPDFETQRAARQALHQVICFAGKPGSPQAAQAVEKELLLLLHHRHTQVRRDALWLLSEIGSETSVAPIARLLNDPDAREDARCALLRLPFPQCVAALKSALQDSPEAFKPALADALRLKGETVEGYPSRKKTPVGQTEVKPFGTNRP